MVPYRGSWSVEKRLELVRTYVVLEQKQLVLASVIDALRLIQSHPGTTIHVEPSGISHASRRCRRAPQYERARDNACVEAHGTCKQIELEMSVSSLGRQDLILYGPRRSSRV